MGGIHGKKRFQCEKCEKPFSWRLDLIEHLKECMTTHKKKKSNISIECYLLEFCFLCGLRVLGECSEEASIINGSSQLKYSQQPVMEVLTRIVEDDEIKVHVGHTIVLCKTCMDNINKWDATEQQLKELGRDISNTFRNRKLNYKEVEPTYKVRRLKRKNNGKNEDYFLDTENSIGCTKESEVIINIDAGKIKEESSSMIQEINRETTFSRNMEFHCDCGKKVVGMDALVDHQLTSGCKIRTNSFPCKYCETIFSERKLLIQHKKLCEQSSLVNGGYECDICGRRFLKRGRVDTHKRDVHKIGTADQQLCSYCGRTFGSPYSMKNHLAREHGIGEIKKIVCDLCGGKFSDRSSLRNHMINIHKEKKFDCELCGKKFPTAGTMNHHMNEIHKNTYTYDCNICGQQFHVGFKYRYHMRKMHNNVQYGCDSCGRTFVMKSDLYRHVRGVHMGIRDPKRYPCKICGRLFPSMYKVKRHMGSHIQQQQQMIGCDMEAVSAVGRGSGRVCSMAVEQQTSTATASITIEEDSSMVDQQGHLEQGTTATISVHHLAYDVRNSFSESVDMTNLSANMIVREVGSDDLVAAEQLVVGPVPGIVLSGSGSHQGIVLPAPRGHETITLHTENQSGSYNSQLKQICEELPSVDGGNSSDLVSGHTLSNTATIMPLHQMIVIHEASNNLIGQRAVTQRPVVVPNGDTTVESNGRILASSSAVSTCSSNTAAGNTACLAQIGQVNSLTQTDTLRQSDQAHTLMESDTLTLESVTQQSTEKITELQYHYFTP